MQNEIARLESIPDGRVTVLTFKGGEVLELVDYEEVDESIYSKTGILTAGVQRKLVGDLRFHTPGTIIEFEFRHVECVKELDGTVIYQAAN